MYYIEVHTHLVFKDFLIFAVIILNAVLIQLLITIHLIITITIQLLITITIQLLIAITIIAKYFKVSLRTNNFVVFLVIVEYRIRPCIVLSVLFL